MARGRVAHIHARRTTAATVRSKKRKATGFGGPKPSPMTLVPMRGPGRRKGLQVTGTGPGTILLAGRPAFSGKRALDKYLRAKHHAVTGQRVTGSFQDARLDRSHTYDWHGIREHVQHWANISSGHADEAAAERRFHALYGERDANRDSALSGASERHYRRMGQLLDTARSLKATGGANYLTAIRRLATHLNSAPPNLRLGHSETNQFLRDRPDLPSTQSPGGTSHSTPNSRQAAEAWHGQAARQMDTMPDLVLSSTGQSTSGRSLLTIPASQSSPRLAAMQRGEQPSSFSLGPPATVLSTLRRARGRRKARGTLASS